MRFARNAPLAGREVPAGHRGGKITRQPSATSKPLVPVTERKSQEENTYVWRFKKDSEGEKTDITPDGGSAGREGRQFTVANVGNNGRIYLRWDSPDICNRYLARVTREEPRAGFYCVLLAC